MFPIPILVVVVVIMVGVIHVRPTFSSNMSSSSAIITSYISSCRRRLFLYICLFPATIVIVLPLKLVWITIAIILVLSPVIALYWLLVSFVPLIVWIQSFVAVKTIFPVMRWTLIPAARVAAILSLLAWKTGVPTLQWWWSRKSHSWISSRLTI